MPVQRQTALKVRISELIQGKWVKKEGMEPSFVETASGLNVSRARVLGTVVGIFMAEDGMFASITVDDGTDTIRAKTFKTVKPLDSLKVGEQVDLIGKVREWNDEIYIIPECVNVVSNPNIELLRRAELLKRGGSQAGAQRGEKKEEVSDKENLRKEILELLEANRDGITYSDILAKLKKPGEELEPVINELLAEGICYEPTPGKVKKI